MTRSPRSWCAQAEGRRAAVWRVQLKRGGGAGDWRAQVLLDPVTLPCCGTNFDKACLDKHMEANPNRASCPMCREALPATLPAVGVGVER